MNILITNNPLVNDKYEDEINVKFIDCALIDVLFCVRDYIHKGSLLLSHPLSGSVKPNETPYKSVLISDSSGEVDLRSLKTIEQCIIAVQKFEPNEIPQNYLKDLQVVDYSIISQALI